MAASLWRRSATAIAARVCTSVRERGIDRVVAVQEAEDARRAIAQVCRLSCTVGALLVAALDQARSAAASP